MTVTEYALKFDTLAKFAPDLVSTYAARQDRFIRGLNDMIARGVIITTVPGGTTYAQAVEKALTTKEVENKIWRENAVRREVHRAVPPYSGSGRGRGPCDLKRKTPDTSTAAGPDRRGQSVQGGCQGGGDTWRIYPECTRCRRRHSGECRAKAYYVCGVVGHLNKDCPTVKKGEIGKVDSLTLARVFTLTQAEAEASPSVVTSQLSSAGSPFTVLIESGVTHSFVSIKVIDRLCRPSE
ncbi:uncharacterized protein LOC133818733 [Humulus lupulus]|uniref:uncharacterized protein LOC133818733 n=1 Tax=Humulus lupulus TaxID=3486 RepID=UPI002B4059D0|nr:uncharacterized protein LOC133818733 [Humulus lupulus]